MNYKVEVFETAKGKRFRVIDNEGAVLDDAQGWGFKTEDDALRCWEYKTIDKSNFLSPFKIANQLFKDSPDLKDMLVDYINKVLDQYEDYPSTNVFFHSKIFYNEFENKIFDIVKADSVYQKKYSQYESANLKRAIIKIVGETFCWYKD